MSSPIIFFFYFVYFFIYTFEHPDLVEPQVEIRKIFCVFQFDDVVSFLASLSGDDFLDESVEVEFVFDYVGGHEELSELLVVSELPAHRGLLALVLLRVRLNQFLVGQVRLGGDAYLVEVGRDGGVVQLCFNFSLDLLERTDFGGDLLLLRVLQVLHLAFLEEVVHQVRSGGFPFLQHSLQLQQVLVQGVQTQVQRTYTGIGMLFVGVHRILLPEAHWALFTYLCVMFVGVILLVRNVANLRLGSSRPRGVGLRLRLRLVVVVHIAVGLISFDALVTMTGFMIGGHGIHLEFVKV